MGSRSARKVMDDKRNHPSSITHHPSSITNDSIVSYETSSINNDTSFERFQIWRAEEGGVERGKREGYFRLTEGGEVMDEDFSYRDVLVGR